MQRGLNRSRCRKNGKTDEKIAVTSNMDFFNHYIIKIKWFKLQNFGSIISRVIATFFNFKYIEVGWCATTTTLYLRRTCCLPCVKKRGFTFGLIPHEPFVLPT